MDERINNELARLIELAKPGGAMSTADRHALNTYHAIAHIAYSLQELEACIRNGDLHPSTGPERRELFAIVEQGLRMIALEANAKGTP